MVWLRKNLEDIRMKLCPGCNALLFRHPVTGEEIDGCSACGGVWFDPGEFERLRRKRPAELMAIDRAVRATQTGKGQGLNRCPLCASQLEPAAEGPLADSTARRCADCGGVWFPSGALVDLAAALPDSPADATPQARTADETNTELGFSVALQDRRSFFVGDRVAWTQSLGLAAGGLLGWLLGGIEDGSQLGLAALLAVSIGLIAGFIAARRRRRLYFHAGWRLPAGLMLVAWCGVSSAAAAIACIWVDPLNVPLVSLFVLAMYLPGYYLARLMRSRRHSASRSVRAGLIVLGAGFLLAATVPSGLERFYAGLRQCGVAESWTFAAVRDCQPAVSGLYLMFFGVGLLISFGIHTFMLHALYDPKGLDVIENPPNELLMKMLLGSMIITFIAWLLMLVLLPPVAGGGGGGGSKSGSRSSGGSDGSGRTWGGHGVLGWSREKETRERWTRYGLS
jgi:Zn-finger nucleic acid-binding protein/uncharacterized membrane protein YgcG